ncbi:MAG: HlyD family efflux transporter periplasmic adaptor subunit, partial [Deltaproteobacteria bacterium]|nr:HlyD family efflux transporter periplasmic adaptor subunit [Deltaproteobacteria bacterium]
AGAGAGRSVAALGRLEPRGGVIRVAGPARAAVVISELLVKEGDWVEAGQRIAILDSHALNKAEITQLEAMLASAERELARAQRLAKGGVSSDAQFDIAQTAETVARAQLARAQAELDLSIVTAPFAGEILDIHARTGERVGPDGIAELGRTESMYAVAEVYETDIRFVEVGQRAVVRSPAFAEPIGGSVERIGRKIGKNDVLSDDPAARSDARVVEVQIRLDDSSETSGLTNLQVEVELEL